MIGFSMLALMDWWWDSHGQMGMNTSFIGWPEEPQKKRIMISECSLRSTEHAAKIMQPLMHKYSNKLAGTCRKRKTEYIVYLQTVSLS